MLKNILNVNGVQELNKKEQKTVNGGTFHTNCDDIQGCMYGGSLVFIGGRPRLMCCAGSPDN
ncbi:hypothetical protein [uncultured Aquimarina sp.]|uniref:hypothetical protein n=1 Tax=uncultured Aquimarina sp. TaxID=575652 RepID=UPI00262295B2|nr:hypothetical protein [uncultured Aquimarina sp.]